MENWKQIYETVIIKASDVDTTNDFSGKLEDANWLMHLRLAYTLDPCLWNELRLGIFQDLLKVSGLRKSASKTHQK